MPHINSLRVANVHFNNATQFYDDFIMDMGGRNTTYDLENGGGKSLLLLMLLQTVLPKSYLRKEKPISLLFQGGRDRTSHAVVEWILEEGESYKYLLTGFCARKRKGASAPTGPEGSDEDDRLQAADIEHLNWCIFYNDHKITGMKSLPLVAEEAGKKSYAGFEDIRKYIQQMKQRGLPAEVFDSIDKYQNYLSAHNLITAEWNIIRGINSGENSIESYFRQNGTSRKLIENQFVKIVEDVEALNNGGKANDASFLLADTLILIRSSLNEYQQLKGHMAEFERIKEYYQDFASRNDDLREAFTAFEDCKMQAVAIHNLLLNNLNILEKQKNEVIMRKESNFTGSCEGQQLKRLLQAGLVNYEKMQMIAHKRGLDSERDRLAVTGQELEGHLNHLMTLEGYGEYRTVKRKASENRRCLQSLEEDEDVLKATYRIAGGKLHFLMARRSEEIQLFSQSMRETQQKLTDAKKQTQQALIEQEKKKSVLEAELEKLTKVEKTIGNQLTQLNEYFLGRGEMESALSPDQFLSPAENELDQYLTENDNISVQIKAIDTRVQSLKIDVVKTESEIDKHQITQKQCQTWLDAYHKESSKLENKATVFSKNTIREYKEELELLIYKESLNQLEKEIETGRLRQKQQLSEERGYYVPNEEVLSLAGQLHDKCEFVKAGIDWMNEIEPEERDSVLAAMPYLPFAVIVDKTAFARLKNGRLKLDFASDYPLPIVNLETVRAMPSSAPEDIYYFCSFSGLLLDHGQYEQFIEKIAAEMNNIAIEITAAGSRLTAFNHDLSQVNKFFAKYPRDEVDNYQERLAAAVLELAGLHKCQEDINAQSKRVLTERDALERRQEVYLKLIEECREKISKLYATIQANQDLAATREELTGKRKEHIILETNINNIGIEAEQLEQKYNQNQAQLHQLEFELHDLNKEQEQLASFMEIENGGSIIEAQTEYRALHEVVSGRTIEESRLRKELDDCELRLRTLHERIYRDYGEDLEEVEKSEMEGALISLPDRTMITTAKRHKGENFRNLSAVEKQVIEMDARIQNAEYKLKDILADVPDPTEVDLPYYDSDNRYRQEIEAVEQLIKSYDDGVAMANEEIERVSREEYQLGRQAEDYEAFLEREKVAISAALVPEAKDYRLYEKEFRHWQEIIQAQCSKWDERMNTIKVETAAFIIRDPVEELGKISKPGSAGQCHERQAAFAEYIANINEQMQKISHDIIQLESYQQDFTRRCIQRAELLLGQLRKLEPLSRIEVNGRRTSMIELKLLEFEAREKQLRMKAHIEGIVREIGQEETVDRKRIASQLSTKELLAQIADMDKAAVRLYKIESIPENSRFYRWETAIGSEGQNNSLYFIFAACLISFIRMLSISNTAVRTRKVIIADNPFGPTSAVYLWDPMFKIMKQNNIQLIAPGHKITREITSRFAVSYLLNQDILQDGRMRVVVKDVRVEEDEDRVKYLEAEQMLMF